MAARALLARHASGRWALLPDMDEHFVFAGMERQSLADYIAALEAEGAEAVLTVMIDMYADLPLAEHLYPRPGVDSLLQAFPWFDEAGAGTLGLLHHVQFQQGAAQGGDAAAIGSWRLARPAVPGAGAAHEPGWRWRRWTAWRGLGGAVQPRGLDLIRHQIARKLTRRFFKGALDMHKVALLRWRPGTNFVGAHRLRECYRMSESIAALLHFVHPWRCRAGIYRAARSAFRWRAALSRHAGRDRDSGTLAAVFRQPAMARQCLVARDHSRGSGTLDVYEATIFPAFAIVGAGTKTGYDAHMPARGMALRRQA